MVAPIRDQGNLTHSATTISFNSLKLMPGQNINMETNSFKSMFDLEHNLDEVRGHSLDMSIYRPKSPSLSSSKSGEKYYIRVKHESDRMDEDESAISSSNFSLEYKI